MAHIKTFSEAEARLAIDALDLKTRSEVVRFFALGRPDGPVPRFLYKFDHASSERSLRGIIVSSSIWLSSPSDFNDPFDLRANVDVPGGTNEQVRIVAKKLRKGGLADRPGEARERAAAIVASGIYAPTLQAEFDKQVALFGVTCFSSTRPRMTRRNGPRDIVMWSHYANEHRGVCLLFHTVKAPSLFVRSKQVTYQDEVIAINWLDQAARGDLLHESLTRKSDVWTYESEYRVFIPDRAKSLEKFRSDGLTGVILGCRASAETAQMIVDLCRERAQGGGGPLRLFRSTQAKRSYRLIIVRARDLEGAAFNAGAYAT